MNSSLSPSNKKKVIPITLICLGTLLNCSVSKHKIPKNYVDHPAILPKGMNQNSLTINKPMLQSDNFTRDLALSLIYSVIPSRGIATNWEMPVFPFPWFTYLFNENDYYKLNRIGYDKLYQLISFGLTNIGYSSRDGVDYGLHLAYRNIFVFNGKFRNECVASFYYDHNNHSTEERFYLDNTTFFKVWDNTSLSAGINFHAGNEDQEYLTSGGINT